MSESDSACPACGTVLQRAAAPGGVRYQCPACRGAAIGLPVLRRMLADGAAIQLWMLAEEAPAEGRPCAFCHQPMRPVTVSSGTGPAATAEVCRPCEMIWVPADQAAALPGRAQAAPAPAALALPACCPSCGAPLQTDADGTCRYCHRQAVAPQLVVLPDPAGAAWTGPGAGRPGEAAVTGLPSGAGHLQAGHLLEEAASVLGHLFGP